MNYTLLTKEELLLEKEKLQKEYDEYAKSGLDINMTRGKPCTEQLDIVKDLLTVLVDNSDCFAQDGFDCRNYGLVDGIGEAKSLFAPIIGVPEKQIIMGGNSSLNLMYDAMARCMLYGVYGGNGPWVRQGKVKFLCPVPGYDRHFAICESLGIEMVNVPLLKDGPDMDVVEELIKDESVKGIWCVPKYANPTGTTYSEKTVKRLASMKPASSDFRIFWDNAYAVHDLYEDKVDELCDILSECEKAGNENMVFIFASTSKISYPGAGISCIGASAENIKHIKSIMQMQTIGHDKINMLRHVKFYKDADGIKAFMKKHADILRPKFEVCDRVLCENLEGSGIASWTKPLGGYFISLDVLEGCAKRVISLAKDAGVVMTEAGSTFPYHKDPMDSNMRIAPSFPTVAELEKGMQVLCVCVKLASVEKLLSK